MLCSYIIVKKCTAPDKAMLFFLSDNDIIFQYY